MQTQKFDIIGMTCSACAAHIEKNVGKREGVQSVNVNLLANTMSVTFDENTITKNSIITAVTQAGYTALLRNPPHETKKNPPTDVSKQEQYDMKRRWQVSLVFLIPLLYISMGEMIGLPVISVFKGNENAVIFVFVQFLLVLPVLYVNRSYYTNGFKALLKCSPNMNSLIAVGSFAAIAYGIFALLRIGYALGHGEMTLVHTYRHNLYFESAATILTLVTLGKYIETKSKHKTSESIAKLMTLSPKTATVFCNGKEEEIAIEDVRQGDLVIVKMGERIPVDGIIEEGTSSIDESVLTGESMPVFRQKGDAVLSGSISMSGYFKMRATKVGNDSTLSQIIALVEEASASKAPVGKLADRISRIFVPTVLLIAVMSSVIWMMMGYSFDFALDIGISVLVISCPCALGLATPVAIMAGTGKGFQYAILIKSAEALETAHKIDTVVMDKTGTLTEGKPEVTNIICENTVSENELLQIAFALEHSSAHPLANAILKKARQMQLPRMETDFFQTIPGLGIQAQINRQTYYAGNIHLMEQLHIETATWETVINNLAQEGKTPLLIANTDCILGIIAVADVLKPDSKEAVKRMKEMGMETVMLTGDHYRTACAIKSQLDVSTAIAEVLPDDKDKEIIKLQTAKKTVAMIGDGINDAPALMRSDLGIALGAGTDIAIESADIVLMRNSLLDAVLLFCLAKKVMRIIKQNLFWAFFYNILGIPLASGVLYPLLGWKLSPMFAAVAMSLSSITVVLNALRLTYFNPKKDCHLCR
ncbi:MAG: heavy metal translocating P-type ATPase [Bacteroidales bacterium]|jgi:heavy metal translocating P-type ATPase|nr:heavy metal translocating P-type ATPase [Bacteroidales bacterium]